jgi:hypothetical protein
MYNKEKLVKVLEDAMLKTLENMTLDEIKQIDWFNSSNYQRVGCTEVKKWKIE